MTLIDIIAAIILFFSFIGGVTQGAIKSFFSLLSFIIAIPVAGRFYSFFADWLNFLPGQNWRNFLGFFIALAVANVVLALIFYFPRKITEESWDNGFISRLVGGFLNLLGAAIVLVMLALIISAYPVWGWLQQALVDSTLIHWLVANLNFVQGLLPDILRNQVQHTF